MDQLLLLDRGAARAPARAGKDTAKGEGGLGLD